MFNKLLSIPNRFRRLLQRFFRKSSTFNRQPLNGGSLVVIILIDIFILVNVFLGLYEISTWPLSPDSTYPCYSQWQAYRQSKEADKNYDVVSQAIGLPPVETYGQAPSRGYRYAKAEFGHLGKVDARCLSFANLQDTLATPDNQKIVASINDKLYKIRGFEDSNRSIRQQYDSTLLEKIAGQAPNQSINNVAAEKAKQTLDANNASIKQLNQEIGDQKKIIIAQPQAIALLSRFQDGSAFGEIDKAYGHAAFWYPSIQLVFQALFLVPLILFFGALHRFALRKNYELVALISWHLLIISVVPALIKLFEFLQIGVLIQWIARAIADFFGGLLFLVSYVRILLIPLIGFWLIKLLQRAGKPTVNPQLQAATRILESRCLSCAKKIRHEDAHCYHCGYQQYAECPSCHAITHQHMPHCSHCGAETYFDPNVIRRSTKESREEISNFPESF